MWQQSKFPGESRTVHELLSLKLGTGPALLPLYPMDQSKPQDQPDSRGEKGDSTSS